MNAHADRRSRSVVTDRVEIFERSLIVEVAFLHIYIATSHNSLGVRHLNAAKRMGRQTLRFDSRPTILASACVAGKRESEGPLGKTFDYTTNDTTFGEKTWEKAESRMQKDTLGLLSNKAKVPLDSIDLLCAGDLLNQCIGTSFGVRESQLPCLGLYGACSTMAESLLVCAMAVDGKYAQHAVAMTSSHYCSAERQYRMPLEYGGQRAPTAQWTVTGAGACLVSNETAPNLPRITHATVGKIVDCGVTDAAHMGGAMAPAAYETIRAFWQDTGMKPSDFDLIATGDLGAVGKAVVEDLFKADGIELSKRYNDCGLMIFDANSQDVHAGGSGCGCGAVVLCGHLLERMRAQVLKRILFCGTGALLSPVSSMQGESIPGICHAVCIELGA